MLRNPFGLLLLPYFFVKYTNRGSLWSRRCHVLAVFFVVLGRIKLCRWREQQFIKEEDEKEGGSSIEKNENDDDMIPNYGESCTTETLWEVNYEISARFLYMSVLQLQGLWTKTAQYLASRSDFVPQAYIRELSRLHDQAPATDWKVIQASLPRRIRQALIELDPMPMASASIGQVHRAKIKLDQVDGDLSTTTTDVVVKVQHPQAKRLMTDDFRSLLWMCRITKWLEPEYGFLDIIMTEWASEARKELDFMQEAANLQDARQALQAHQDDHATWTTSPAAGDDAGVFFSVQVPKPILALTTEKILVMEYCEGVKVDRLEQIDTWGISRTAMMDGISQAFAYFMYSSTIFNADPHVGNMLVRPGLCALDKNGLAETKDDQTPSGASQKASPFTIVILDWGLAKRLVEQKRLAFCQMVYAAATLDYGLLLDSYETIGLRMKQENTGQEMQDIRFFLRDMEPRETVRSKIKLKMKDMKVRGILWACCCCYK